MSRRDLDDLARVREPPTRTAGRSVGGPAARHGDRVVLDVVRADRRSRHRDGDVRLPLVDVPLAASEVEVDVRFVVRRDERETVDVHERVEVVGVGLRRCGLGVQFSWRIIDVC